MRKILIGFGILVLIAMVLPAMAYTAQGKGSVTYINAVNVKQTDSISFSANNILGSGLNDASGYFSYRMVDLWDPGLPKNLPFKGTITYLRVDGNNAYMAGTITDSVLPENYVGAVGDCFYLAISINRGNILSTSAMSAVPGSCRETAQNPNGPFLPDKKTQGNFVIKIGPLET